MAFQRWHIFDALMEHLLYTRPSAEYQTNILPLASCRVGIPFTSQVRTLEAVKVTWPKSHRRSWVWKLY